MDDRPVDARRPAAHPPSVGAVAVGLPATVRSRGGTRGGSLASLSRWRPDGILWGVYALVAVVIVLFLAKIGVLLWQSVHAEMSVHGAGATLENFSSVFGSRLFPRALMNTVVFALGSVAVMLLVAIPMAWLYARTDLPRKDLLITIITVKSAIPSFLVALGYIVLANPTNGILNQLLRMISPDVGLLNVYSMGWMILLQGLGLASPAFFMIAPTMRAIDSSLEEVASVSGVSRLTTLIRIIIPLSMPAIIATAIFFLIVAVESFDIPSMLGLPTRTFVLSTWLYLMIHQGADLPRYGEAAALGVLISCGASLLTILYFWATREAGRFVVVSGKRAKQQPLALSRGGRIVAWCGIGMFALVTLILPLVMLLWSSFAPVVQISTGNVLETFSLNGYREAFERIGTPLANSLITMLCGSTLAVAFATSLAWVNVRSTIKGRWMIDVLVMITVAIPSIVVALAFLYMGLWVNRYIPIYTTIWLIVIAVAVRLTGWANRTISAAMLQVHRELEEAGSVSGVRRGRVLWSILLPVLRPAILFSWFWLMIIVLRELTIPVMLARPGTEVMATEIFKLAQLGQIPAASAMGVFLVVMIGVMVTIFHRYIRERT